jgi:hypothetical protein
LPGNVAAVRSGGQGGDYVGRCDDRRNQKYYGEYPEERGDLGRFAASAFKELTARERDLLKLTLENHPQLSVSDALPALRAGGM